jgi:hypothetical protein
MTLGAIPLAIETINNDPNLLPGRKLQFVAADIGNPGMEFITLSLSIYIYVYEFVTCTPLKLLSAQHGSFLMWVAEISVIREKSNLHIIP